MFNKMHETFNTLNHMKTHLT